MIGLALRSVYGFTIVLQSVYWIACCMCTYFSQHDMVFATKITLPAKAPPPHIGIKHSPTLLMESAAFEHKALWPMAEAELW